MPLQTQDFDPFKRHGTTHSSRILKLLQKYLPQGIMVERLETPPGSEKYRLEGAGLPPATLFRFTAEGSDKEIIVPVAMGPRSTLTQEEVPLVQIGTGYIPEIPMGEIRREGVEGVPGFEVLARRVAYGFNVGEITGDPQAEFVQSYYQATQNQDFLLPSGSLYINQFESMQQAGRWAASMAHAVKAPDVYESAVPEILAKSTTRMGKGWPFSAYMPATGGDSPRIVGPGYFAPMTTNIAADASIGTGFFYDKPENLMKRVPILGHRQAAIALRMTDPGRYEPIAARRVEEVGEGPAWARMTGTMGTARDVDEGVYMRVAIPEHGLARYPGSSVLDATRFGEISAFAFESRQRVPIEEDLATLIRPDRTAGIRFPDIAGKRFEAGQEVTIAEIYRGMEKEKEVWDPIKFTVGARPFVASQQGAFINIPYNAPKGIVEALEKAEIPFTLRGDVSSAGLGSAVHLPGYQITDVSFKTGSKTFQSILPEDVRLSAGNLPIDLITETKSPEYDYLQAVFSLPRKEQLSFLHGFASSKEYGAPGMQGWLEKEYGGRAQISQSAVAQEYNRLTGAGDRRPFEAALYQYFLKGIQNPVTNQLWMQNYGMGMWEGELPVGMFSPGEMETYQAAARRAEALTESRPGAFEKRLRFEEQPSGDYLGYQRDRWLIYNKVNRPTPEMTGQVLMGAPEMAAIEAAGYTQFAQETGLLLSMNPLEAGETARDMPLSKRAWYHRLSTWMGMAEKVPMPGTNILEEADIYRMRAILGEESGPVEQVKALSEWYEQRFDLSPKRFRALGLEHGYSLEDPRAILATDELDQLTQETRGHVVSRYVRHAKELLDPSIYGNEPSMRSVAYRYQRAMEKQLTNKTDLVKELMGRRIATSVFGHYKENPLLEANMVALSDERLLAMFGRTIGARGLDDPRLQELKEFMARSGGIPSLAFRYPTLRRGDAGLPATLPVNIVTPEMAGIKQPPGAGAFLEQDFSTGSLFSEVFYGDKDADPATVLSFLSYNPKTREFYTTGDPELRAAVERYADPEQARLLAEEVRARVSTGMSEEELKEWGEGSALTKQFMDILSAKPGFPGKATPIDLKELQGVVDDYSEVMRARGLAYNMFLRGTEVSMARKGWGKEMIGRTLDAAMMQYQQPLDVKRGVSAMEQVYSTARFNIWDAQSFPGSRGKFVMQWRIDKDPAERRRKGGRPPAYFPVWAEGEKETGVIKALADVAVRTEMAAPELLAGWFASKPEHYQEVLEAMQGAEPGEQFQRLVQMIEGGKLVNFESPLVDQILNQAIIRGQKPHYKSGLEGSVRFAGKTFQGQEWDELYEGTQGFRALDRFWKKSGLASPSVLIGAMEELGESASYDALQSLLTSVGVHTPEQFAALKQAMTVQAGMRNEYTRAYLEGGTLPKQARMSEFGALAAGSDKYGALTKARLGYLSRIGGVDEVFENLILGPESWITEAPSGAAELGQEWEKTIAASPEVRKRLGLQVHAGDLRGVEDPTFLHVFPKTRRGAFSAGLVGTGPDFFGIEEGKLVWDDLKRFNRADYENVVRGVEKGKLTPKLKEILLQQKLYAQGLVELGKTGGQVALEDYFYQFSKREADQGLYSEEEAIERSRQMAGIVMEQGEAGMRPRLQMKMPQGTDFDIKTLPLDLSMVDINEEAQRAEDKIFGKNWAFRTLRDVARIMGSDKPFHGLQMRKSLPAAARNIISGAVSGAYDMIATAVGRPSQRPADTILAEANRQAQLDRQAELAELMPTVGGGGDDDDGGDEPPVTTAAPEEEPEEPRRPSGRGRRGARMMDLSVDQYIKVNKESTAEGVALGLARADPLTARAKFEARQVPFVEAQIKVQKAINLAGEAISGDTQTNEMLQFYKEVLPRAIGEGLGLTQIGTTEEMLEKLQEEPRASVWAQVARNIRAAGGMPVLQRAKGTWQAIVSAMQPGVMRSYLAEAHPGTQTDPYLGFFQDEGAPIAAARSGMPGERGEPLQRLVQLQGELQAKGLTSRTGMNQFPVSNEEADRIMQGLMGTMGTLQDKFKSLGEETAKLTDVDAKRRMQLEKDIDVNLAMRRAVSTQMDIVEEQRKLMGGGLEEAEQRRSERRLTALEGQFTDQMFALDEAQQARREVDMPTSAALSRFTRRMLGGWGLFYLGHMARLGWGTLAQGYQESEAFQQQSALMEAGILGAGAGGELYDTDAMRQQRALLRSGRGAFGLIQGARAGMTGPLMRDIGGAALSGIGAYGVLEFAASHAEGLGPLAGIAGALSAYAPLIGAGVGVATVAGAQYQYAKDYQQTGAQAAANLYTGGAWDRLTASFLSIGPTARDIIEGKDWKTFAIQAVQDSRTAQAIVRGEKTLREITNPEERARVAQVLATAEIPEFAGISPEIIQRLTQQGATGEQIRAIGTATMAGVDVMAPAQVLRTLTGADRYTPAAMMPAAVDISRMDETQRARFLGGLDLAGRTPTIRDLIGGRTDRDAMRYIETVLGRIEGGPGEERYLTRDALRKQRIALGLSPGPRESWRYYREQVWTPEMIAAETQENMMIQRGVQLGENLMARGVELPAMQSMIDLIGQNPQAMRFGEQLAQFNPIAIALQVAAGDTRSAMYNAMDIGMGGQVTGLGLWQTSLRTGASTNAIKDVEMTARSIWGADWQAGDVSGIRGAMAYGIPGPREGQMLYGKQAYQWQMMQWQHEAAAAAASSQMAQLRLGAAFQTGVGLEAYAGAVNPQTGQPFGFNTGQWSVNVPGQGAFTSTGGGFWGLQDASRALANMQQQYNFQQQRQQLEMSQRQFEENMALNRTQALMQRGWARQDWAFQDQTRGLQWQWRQEDFQENLRFMTGRERRMAERQMGRETVMHGLEGEQIDTQRKRQEEIWRLEDERFDITKRHNQEQKKFQEEAIKTQELFWKERRRLEEESELMSRAYWVEQQKLQEAAAGAQAGLAEKMRQAQEDMLALSIIEDERMGKIKVAQTLEVDMINTLIKGYNHILKHMGIEKLIPPFLADAGGGGAGGSGTRTGGKKASGGMVVPGTPWIVGEHEPEIFTPGQIGRIIPLNQARADPWNNAVFQVNRPSGKGGKQPIHLTVQIGDEVLGTYILDTVEQKIKVL